MKPEIIAKRHFLLTVLKYRTVVLYNRTAVSLYLSFCVKKIVDKVSIFGDNLNHGIH